MPDPLFISEPDWSSFQDLESAKKLLVHAQRLGFIDGSEADEVRFWAARGLAMRKGKSPTRYFIWLLRNRDAVISNMDEDAGLEVGRREGEDLDPVALADLIHRQKYPRKTGDDR